MKSALLFAVIVCLLGTTLTLRAQERLESLGPIHRAIAQEADRLASSQPQRSSVPPWWRVKAITPGTRLALTVRDGPARIGLFATADESSVTIVYLSGAPLPFAARRPLENALSEHPDYFVKAQRGQSFPLSQNVQLTPDGVFVVDRRVVSLDQLVETIAYADVARITSAGKTGGSIPWAAGGATAGAVIGVMSAARIAFSPCGGSCGDEQAFMGLSLIGLPVLGGVLGYRSGIHDEQKLIYQAP